MLTEPPAPYLWGSCKVFEDGGAEVYIDPLLELDDQLKVFLHELAHVKQFRAARATAPRTEGYQASKQVVTTWESRAEIQAQTWLAWAKGQPLGKTALGQLLELTRYGR
jgi:hypothetical protein